MEVENMNCLDKIGKKVLSNIIILEQVGWPPVCVGILYQSERPVDSCIPADNKEPEHKSSTCRLKGGK